MIVACWCGNRFEDAGAMITVCPACKAIATLPRLSTQDEREMQAALDRLPVREPR